jgi:transketolase
MNLETKAREIRGMILDQVFAFGNGHIASAFSCTEILLYLYWRVLKVNAANPDWPDRDRLIISKGHGVSALYAILADMGFFPKEWLTAPQDGNLLGGHADWKVPGIDWSTGSLGHGLSVAAGMALAAKMNGQNHRIFCLLGDGEMQEGSVWESAMFAAYHNLNIAAIIDRNCYQSCGATGDVLAVDPLEDKWESFGWSPIVADGHSFSGLEHAFFSCKNSTGPSVIVAYTKKGYGVSFIENGDKWHVGIPTESEILSAKMELRLV